MVQRRLFEAKLVNLINQWLCFVIEDEKVAVLSKDKYGFRTILNLKISTLRFIFAPCKVAIKPSGSGKEKSVIEIWINHEKRANKTRVVYNPRPNSFANAAKPEELNIFPGFRYARDSVLNFTNYELLEPLLTHIRNAWCDTEEEYNHIVGSLPRRI